MSIQEVPLVIKNIPEKIELKLDDNLELEVEAIGEEPLNYQWYFNSQVLAGETTNKYIIDKVSQLNEGQYTCHISNLCGYVYSNLCNVSITTAGVISNINNDELKNHFKITPNITNDIIEVVYTLQENSDIEFELLDATGNKVKSLVKEKRNSGKHRFSFSFKSINVSNGAYFISMNINGSNVFFDKVNYFD